METVLQENYYLGRWFAVLSSEILELPPRLLTVSTYRSFVVSLSDIELDMSLFSDVKGNYIVEGIRRFFLKSKEIF